MCEFKILERRISSRRGCKFLVGVCCWFSKFWPYFCPKNVIFHTRFQNWHLKSITVIRPGLKAEIMLWLFRLKRKQKDFSTSISNSHISLTFFFILNWNDQYVYTLSVPSEPYLIPDKNGQNVYPFSDQNGTKTIPILIYSQLLITRTLKGNWKKVWVIESSTKIAGSKGKNSFYCTVSILITFNSRNVKWKLKDNCRL